MQCVLCYLGDATGEELVGEDAFNIACPRCGSYRATGRAHAMLSAGGLFDAKQEARLRLTWAARQASELGAPLELAEWNLDEIANSVVEPNPLSRKLDEVVCLYGSKAVAFGKPVALDKDKDWPLAFARDPTEFSSLVVWLANDGLLTETSGGLYLTPKGWERFTSLEAERPGSKTAFVAMSFAGEMKPAYEQGFYPALHDLGYDPIRVDREEYLGKIDDFIIASIRKSALLVADFTGVRTGVFFEAGFGLGLGVPVVWTCREDSVAELAKHFDTRQYNHLVWRAPADLAARLRARIEATVVGRPRPRKRANVDPLLAEALNEMESPQPNWERFSKTSPRKPRTDGPHRR